MAGLAVPVTLLAPDICRPAFSVSAVQGADVVVTGIGPGSLAGKRLDPVA